jgi:hypothetical protein
LLSGNILAAGANVGARLKEDQKLMQTLMDSLHLSYCSELSSNRSTTEESNADFSSWFICLAPVTSCTSIELSKLAIDNIDAFAHHMSTPGFDERCNTPEKEKAMFKLINIASENISMVLTNILERLLFLSDSCVKGFIDAASTSATLSESTKPTNRRALSSSGAPQVLSQSTLGGCRVALFEVFKLSSTLPFPWSNRSHADYFIDRLKMAALFKTEIGDLPLELGQEINKMSTNIPAFVINLTRRYDRYLLKSKLMDIKSNHLLDLRWQKILQLCYNNDLSAIRVPAVDGSVKSTAQYSESQVSDNLDKAVIPESFVRFAWDTTLNSVSI